jgi:hypothetical protein
MQVLVACEFSGTVRDAFAWQGHSAWSCDLLPTEQPFMVNSRSGHYWGDVKNIINDSTHWDLMIAHPPCTRLANSGVRWLHERNLWAEMKEAAEFFKWLLDAPIDRICIENPIPHKYALDIIGRKYDQIIQPWQFGHGETKATCLWLKNLEPLRPTSVVEGRSARVHKCPPSPDRWKERSRTYTGIAQAMAAQWGAEP